jgi:hypothetical protein
MVDLVTKDPNEYRLFAMMPLLLSSAAFSLGAVLYAKPIITPLAMVCLVCYKYVKKPFGWGIRQVYGGLILEAWVSMRKFSGEMFDGAPTVVAMGRQAEFNAMINSRYFTREFPCTVYDYVHVLTSSAGLTALQGYSFHHCTLARLAVPTFTACLLILCGRRFPWPL